MCYCYCVSLLCAPVQPGFTTLAVDIQIVYPTPSIPETFLEHLDRENAWNRERKVRSVFGW